MLVLRYDFEIEQCGVGTSFDKAYRSSIGSGRFNGFKESDKFVKVHPKFHGLHGFPGSWSMDLSNVPKNLGSKSKIIVYQSIINLCLAYIWDKRES